ncbi:MAG: TIM-barrel domain-containing protein [Ferruginibacter sp.]
MIIRLHFSLLIVLTFFIANGQTEKIKTDKGEFKFQQYADNIFKVTYQPAGYLTNENVNDAVILTHLQQKPNKKIFERRFEESIFFKNTRINFSNGRISFGSGNNIVMENVFQVDGFRGFRFKLQPGEKIYGGGERALPLNRRGYKFPLYNNPWYGYSEGADALNYSVPFFTSSNGYGLFFDNASKGYADIGKTTNDIFEAGFMSGELNVYVIFGKDYKEIMSSYYKLTGTQPLPPRWALGNFMSRFGYSGEKDVKNIASKMKEEKIPFDAVIFDLFWFGDSIKGTLGNLDWLNTTKWPDPKGMIGDFKKDNINTILIAEPFILKGTKNYEKAEKYFAVDSVGKPFNLTDFYFGQGGLLDIFRKDAGNWIWKDHYKKQIANGVVGWWTDLGEPEKHPSAIRHNLDDRGVKRLMTADEVHNVYGHYWNKMLFENYANDLPNQRLFHLNRSGFAGSQRYSIFPWSGDVSRSWSGLRAQLPVMLGMSMSGVPYIHADAGGFAGGEGDNELYTRWLQFACFTPIFRPHGTALFELDKAAFSFPSEPALIEEPWRGYAKEVIKLRYSLMPYNYTLAYLQAAKGAPLVAPLYYYFPNDNSAINVEDEFMWGEHILVAPVLQKGATKRKIYLPGGNWYLLDNIRNGNGPSGTYHSFVDFNVSIDAEPVFVKAGSFVPMVTNSGSANSTSYKTDSLVIQYYMDENPSQYTMYDDDGNNKHSIRLKLFELLNFKAIPSGQKLSFKISSNGATFAGRPQTRNIKIIINGNFDSAKSVYINSKSSAKTYPVTGADGKASGNYYFTFNFSGKPVNIEIK